MSTPIRECSSGWKSCGSSAKGLVYPEAARLAGVSEATVDRYVAIYRQGGLRSLAGIQLGYGYQRT